MAIQVNVSVRRQFINNHHKIGRESGKKVGTKKNKTTIINLQFCGTVFSFFFFIFRHIEKVIHSQAKWNQNCISERAILIVFAIETMRWPKELTREQ